MSIRMIVNHKLPFVALFTIGIQFILYTIYTSSDITSYFNPVVSWTNSSTDQSNELNLTRLTLVLNRTEQLLQEENLLQAIALSPNCPSDVPLTEPYFFCQNSRNIHTLITMFTTIHTRKEKDFIYQNTVQSWALLRPYMRTVLFISTPEADVKFIKFGCKLGWDVLLAPFCSKSLFPVVPSMFIMAQEVFPSTFYGMANGDILFASNLITSLKYVEAHMDMYPKFLIVGQRIGFKLKFGQNVSSLEQIDEFAKKGFLKSGIGIDYFITCKNGYPWSNIPPMVIARPGYDNWLIWFAQRKASDIIGIDFTNTTTAIHQEIVNITSNHASVKADMWHNYKWLKNGYRTDQGHTACTQQKTRILDGHMSMLKRIKFGLCPGKRTNRKKATPDVDEIVIP